MSSPAELESKAAVSSRLNGYHMERMPCFVAPLVLLLAASAPASQLQDGATLFNSRRYAEAERALRSRLAAKPADEHARLYLAKTLIELNRLPDAVAEVQQLAALRSSPEARYQAGLILRQLAERRFQDLEQAAPGSPAVLVLAAQRLERQGNHAEALEHYRAAAKLEPQRPGIHYAIGNALWRARDLESAATELSMELARNPQHGMARFRLAQVLIARGEEAAAIEPLEAAREALPQNLEIQRELGKAYRKAGRLAEARRTWEALARARPGDDQVHFLLGGLYREMGEPARAQAALARHRMILERRRVLSEQQRR